ncbi:hypothetical protein Busp01_25840 [Trinickia caryophylli]|nr:hypothetical protein Busp01_25840 [Trinickia caryophylli]
MAGFATLLGGVTAGLAGQDAQAGALAAQNEALNNSGDHPADAAKKGGLLSQIGDAASAFIDRVKSTFSDPIGDTARGINYFVLGGQSHWPGCAIRPESTVGSDQRPDARRPNRARSCHPTGGTRLLDDRGIGLRLGAAVRCSTGIATAQQCVAVER